jgi:hypothetical protein
MAKHPTIDIDELYNTQGTLFEKHIYIHRERLLAVFQKLVKCPVGVSAQEYIQVFSNFIESFTLDMPIRYSIFMKLFLAYLCYWSYGRSFYCSETGSILTFSCSDYHPTIIRYSDTIQFIFYSALLLCHLFAKVAEGSLILYGSLFLNAGLCVTFWSVSYSEKWILAGTISGSFYAVWLPYIYHWLVMLAISNRLGISHWENQAIIYPVPFSIKQKISSYTVYLQWGHWIFSTFTAIFFIWIYQITMGRSDVHFTWLGTIFMWLLSYASFKIWLTYLVNPSKTVISNQVYLVVCTQ